jgi:hypothetical protein
MDLRFRVTLTAAAACLAVAATGCSNPSKGPSVAALTTTTPTTAASTATSTSATASASEPASSSTAPKGPAGLLAYSQCMRSHGVPDFPDPVGNNLRIQAGPGSDLDFNSPQMVAAQKACKSLQPAGKTDAAATAAAKEQALKHSQCMRSHGVPTFPDPIFSDDGGVQIKISGIDPKSPQFVAATQACKSLEPGDAGPDEGTDTNS